MYVKNFVMSKHIIIMDAWNSIEYEGPSNKIPDYLMNAIAFINDIGLIEIEAY